MSDSLNVLILGYGEMGHAMEHLLAPRHRLSLWDKFPPAGFTPVDLERAAPEADVVVFCLAVNPHPEVIARIAPLLKADCLCLSIAKGLDESGRTAAGIFAETFGGNQPYGLLYGPMISEEIRAGRGGFAQVACSREEDYETVRALFAGSRLYTEHCGDVAGISWAVILKNVYALAFGMADELALGDNVRGFLAVTALSEMADFVEAMGGRRASVYRLAGLGDLITTGTSATSHHRHTGQLLARGERDAITGEGVHTLAMVDRFRLFDWRERPLYAMIHDVVKAGEDAAQRFQTLLKHQYG